MRSLVKNTKITRVMDAKAAGAADVQSTAVDMRGWEGVMFIALFGTLTATQVTSIKAQQATSAAGAYADLADTDVGPLADDDDDKALVLDVKNPRERYVRCTVARKTADAVIDGVVAVQYGPRKMPTAHDSTVAAAEAHSSPAETTA